MRLETSDPAEFRARFKLVRRDDFHEVPGLILEADEETGEASVEQRGETVRVSTGPHGLAIVRR